MGHRSDDSVGFVELWLGTPVWLGRVLRYLTQQNEDQSWCNMPTNGVVGPFFFYCLFLVGNAARQVRVTQLHTTIHSLKVLYFVKVVGENRVSRVAVSTPETLAAKNPAGKHMGFLVATKQLLNPMNISVDGTFKTKTYDFLINCGVSKLIQSKVNPCGVKLCYNKILQ